MFADPVRARVHSRERASDLVQEMLEISEIAVVSDGLLQFVPAVQQLLVHESINGGRHSVPLFDLLSYST
jgi:hypothetical protein